MKGREIPDSDKYFTTLGPEGLILTGPDKDVLAKFPIGIPMRRISEYNFATELDVEEPYGKQVRFAVKDLVLAKDPEKWNHEWEYHQVGPGAHRWRTSEMVYKFGSNSYGDWECGPTPCSENRILFETILSVARSNIDCSRIPEGQSVEEFFNFFVDISLLAFAEMERDPEDWPDYEWKSYILNFCYQLWEILSCDEHVKADHNWYTQDDAKFLDELKPMWDTEEGQEQIEKTFDDLTNLEE
jgi:hypothetical protein